MPAPPPVSLIDRFLFENPWPLSIILLLIAVVILYVAVTQGNTKRLLFGFGALTLAIGIWLLAFFTTTPAEHGERITREFVQHAVAGDSAQAMLLFGPGATMAVGRPDNVGFALAWIRLRLQSLSGDYPIRANYITGLDAYSKNSEQAVVHLHCLTTFDTAYTVPTKSSWVIFVDRQPDGTWKISRLTAIQINDEVPRMTWFP